MKDIEKIERGLFVIDMVNGFVREGAMADPSIEGIIPEVEKLVEEFLKHGDGVFFIKDAHEKDCAEFKRYPKHCVKETSEARLVDELIPYEKYAAGVYEKNSTSAIFAPGLLSDLEKMNNLKELVGVGCCTDICVTNFLIPVQNYFDENNKSVCITVPKNAVETYDAPFHKRDEYNEMAFKLMNQAGVSLVKRYERRGK